jgi:FtsP/CotA-like multicopper oxidase with cupredoxin domain
MPYISKRNRSKEREMENAAKNRREIIAARLNRREMMKMGLLTSAGLLIPKRGLSARALNSAGEPTGWMPSPGVTAFVEPLFIPPIAQPTTQFTVGGWPPKKFPDNNAGEGRTRPHQALENPVLDTNVNRFAPRKLYQVEQREALISVHPEYPPQRLWTFNGTVPGQTYVALYGEPILVRNVNSLPDDNGGFGIPEASTHLHNGHTPSESDGFPCDFFPNTQFPNSFYYDQHYPNVLAGFASTHQPNGDINESMSTLWYHDHRVDFTAQNVYKGLAGFYLLFNNFDTGNETTGFRLPSFPEFDIPMMFNDKNFNNSKILVFDLANRDGILGDRYLVNGKIQPFFEVKKRKYRFRWLNAGPSRFYQFYLTKQNNSNHPFYVIANDGNLLPFSVLTNNGVRIAVAERMDVIVDFSSFNPGDKIWIDNRLEQLNGAGPTDRILPAGQAQNKVLEFRVVDGPVNDQSVNPASITKEARNNRPYFYTVPLREPEDRTRCFKFDREDGQWVINDKVFDCGEVRFKVKMNDTEIWELEGGRDWQHPIHIHFEEHQIIERNRDLPIEIERGRKDVVRLGEGDDVKLFFRFRDFHGRYPMHCHNTIHEDHAMMLRFDIDPLNGNDNEDCHH